jgi:ferredoxin
LKKVKKEDLAAFLDRLASTRTVYAPCRDGEGTVDFQRVTGAAEIADTYGNTRLSIKRLFLPQTETLFSYRNGEDGPVFDVPARPGPAVVFGLRPCDAKSLGMLDGVFANDQYTDPYFTGRRADTVLVGLGCVEPCSTCFCTSVGGGPFDPSGLDVLLSEVPGGYLAEARTEAGASLLGGVPLLDAGSDELAAAAAVKEEATRKADTLPLAGLKERLDGAFDHPVWAKIPEKCLDCGICTFLCPTCHCFDVCDEGTAVAGSRVRIWDSCLFPLYTLHASGHNPRPTGRERYRQRVMHKFRYFVDRLGCTACVGCGRCVVNCPVNLDIRQVVGMIRDQVEAGIRP